MGYMDNIDMNVEILGLIMFLTLGKKMLLVLVIWSESVKLGKSCFYRFHLYHFRFFNFQ